MSQQTFNSGGTTLAEPPAPVLPLGDAGTGGDDNRRKLMVVGAVVGVLVLGIVAYFLMKGGSSSGSDQPLTVTHHRHAPASAAAAQPPVVKLPKHVAAPIGRDPFKALYVAPAAAPVGSTTTGTGSTQPSTTGTTSTTSTGTTAPTTTSFHPVSVQLKSVTSSSAAFDVWYSNGKTLKAVLFSGVKPLHTFASRFELLSVRNGVATVKYGDGSPFQLDHTHSTMAVD